MRVIERTRGVGGEPGYWLGVGLWTCFLPLLCFFSFGYVFICPMWKVERANWLQVFSFILQKDSDRKNNSCALKLFGHIRESSCR